MKKFVALLTQEKVKTAMNDWENDDSDILQVIHSVYKKIKIVLFLCLHCNFCIVIWGKNRIVKIKGKKQDRFEDCLGGKNFENLTYYLIDCLSYNLQPRKTMINILPCSLSNFFCQAHSNFEFQNFSFDFHGILTVKLLLLVLFCSSIKQLNIRCWKTVFRYWLLSFCMV